MKYGGVCAAVALAAMAGLALTACGSSSGVPATRATAAAGTAAGNVGQPVNPVPILRKTGARVPAGTVLGGHDVYGDRMADATFPRSGGESAEVYTTTNLKQSMAEIGPGGFRVDDGDAVVFGQGFWIDVTAGTHWGSDGSIVTSFIVKPAVIAARVGGTVMKQGS